MSMKDFLAYLSFPKYLCSSWSTGIQLVLAIVLVVVCGALGSSYWPRGFAEMWQRVDPVLTVGTLLIAVFIWFNEKKREWENGLPKKLDVYFKVKNDQTGGYDDVYTIINAPLTGGDDVRQWGQQLGRQMNSNKDLRIVGFKVEGPYRKIMEDRETMKRNYVMKYKLTVWLEDPKNEEDPKKEGTRVWEYNYEGIKISDKRDQQ